MTHTYVDMGHMCVELKLMGGWVGGGVNGKQENITKCTDS